ncbi:MAG: iron-containing alcohol dehydrogenase [Minwuia sp.]|uniref:iron-containing alcohol dehydrogenase n=1 Tax=Minwuia sp. TaxID=2493630 RepID=UPI003A83B37B
MAYDFTITGPDRIISGIGALQELPGAMDARGAKRALILTGNSLATKTDLVSQVEAALGSRHAGTFSGCAQHVPSGTVDACQQAALDADADSLVVFGGGSPIDTAKLVVKRLAEAGRTGVTQFVMPTTLSAGEFTYAAGITDETTRVKAVVVDPVMQPEVIVYDPELTRPTPVDLWLTTGIKALDHAVEGVWWPNGHPFTETLRLGAIADLRRHLEASKDPDALDDRLACMHAAWKSIWGLLSAKNVGFRLSHPLGHQIGARWDVPHGVTSCISLPAAARFLHGLLGRGAGEDRGGDGTGESRGCGAGHRGVLRDAGRAQAAFADHGEARRDPAGCQGGFRRAEASRRAGQRHRHAGSFDRIVGVRLVAAGQPFGK